MIIEKRICDCCGRYAGERCQNDYNSDFDGRERKFVVYRARTESFRGGVDMCDDCSEKLDAFMCDMMKT